nr:MAG TPA: hypothetical protein [Caudoviricetes sp.]
MPGDVLPAGIAFLDQLDLPGARPFLDRLFARDRIDDQIVFVEPDQAHRAVASCEFRTRSGLMLQQPAGKVRRHADIQRSVLLRRQNVDATSSPHPVMLLGAGRELKLGLDRCAVSAFRHGSPTLYAPCGRSEVEDDGLHGLLRLTVIVGAWRGHRRRHRRWRLTETLPPPSSSTSQGAKRPENVGDPFRNAEGIPPKQQFNQ